MEENAKINLGDLTMENIITDDIKNNILGEVINKKTTTIICNNLENKNHVIGMAFTAMEEDELNNIKLDNADVKDDSILVIDKYQVIGFIESVNGYISILKANNLLAEYGYNLIIKDIVSTVRNFNITVKSELDRLLNASSSLLEQELKYDNGNTNQKEIIIKKIIEQYDFMIKNYWYISETEFNRIYDDAVKKFTEETSNE